MNAMLLDEVQRQARQAEAQQRDLEAQRRENTALAAQVRRMSEEARQVETLTARLVQLEKTLGARTDASGTRARSVALAVNPG